MLKVKGTKSAPIRSFGALMMLVGVAMTALSLSVGSCFFDTKSNVCEIDGVILRCGPGQHCARKYAEVVCVNSGGCGDGKLDREEVCDDGNLTDDDGCDSNCTPTACGNGIKTTLIVEEQCDDGNMIDGDGCDSNCKTTGCGSGIVTHVEECDDGNNNNEDACLNSCERAVCGDGVVNRISEDCDDGNTEVDVCPYDATSCEVCGETCHYVPGVTSRCGDGVVQVPYEVCDDGNSLECGTCSQDCQTFGLNFAVGRVDVIAANDYKDINDPADPSNDNRDTLTLDDGFTAAIIFEFSRDDNIKFEHIAIKMEAGDSASKVRDILIQKIQDSELLFKATKSGQSGISLRHLLFSGVGNQQISHTVDDTDFVVSGMAGGRGADCSAGDGCKFSADCASHICSGGTPTTVGVCQ